MDEYLFLLWLRWVLHGGLMKGQLLNTGLTWLCDL